MASLTLLQPPTSADPTHTQAILSEAPKFLQSQKQAFTLPYPLSLLVNNESPEKWAAYENILIASLEAGEFNTAKQCVEAITERFGKLNERVIILQGLYDEATALDEKQLLSVLKRYDEIVAESPTMLGVRKRRVALLKSLGRTADAVTSLVEIVDNSPTDAEAWAELSDLYISQGALDRAVFSLEEVLLVMPNAWNVQAKLGEVLYLSAKAAEGAERVKFLSESVRRFCRSIELSSTYLRAFYGLKLATSRLIPLLSNTTDVVGKGSSTADTPLPSQKNIEKLNQVATAKLAEITRHVKLQDATWDGYNASELAAAQSLLAADDTKQSR